MVVLCRVGWHLYALLVGRRARLWFGFVLACAAKSIVRSRRLRGCCVCVGLCGRFASVFAHVVSVSHCHCRVFARVVGDRAG